MNCRVIFEVWDRQDVGPTSGSIMISFVRITCAALIAITAAAHATTVTTRPSASPATRPATQSATPSPATRPSLLAATQPATRPATTAQLTPPVATAPATRPSSIPASRIPHPAPRIPSSATAPFYDELAGLAIHNGDIIVFLGDDLTETPRPNATNSFPTLVETFLTARYATLRARYINVGWSGDTVNRALLRLDRDVLSHKPSVVVICLGLNDPDYLPANEQRLVAYRQGMTALVDKCRQAGARVWLISPPSVEEDKGRKVRIQRTGRFGITDLQAIAYNSTLKQYASAVSEIAAHSHSGFVDWFAESMVARARRRAAQPEFSLTSNGLNPTDRSHAMVAASLLRAWGATPIQVTIELTWATGEVKVAVPAAAARSTAASASTAGAGIPTIAGAGTASAGIPSRTSTISAQSHINAAGARRLVLHDLPLPWPMAGGSGGALSGDWEAAQMCRLILRTPDAPERGVLIRFDWPQGQMLVDAPVLPDLLRSGFNLACTEAFNAAKEVSGLFQLIGTKNYYQYGTWRKLALSPPREAELVEAHRKLIDAWNSYVTGTERIIFNQQRTFDLRLFLTEAVPVEQLPTHTPPRPPVARPRISPPTVPTAPTPSAPPPLPISAAASRPSSAPASQPATSSAS